MSARDCFSGNRYKISKSYGKSPNVVQKEYVGNHQKSFIVPLLHSAHTGLDSQLALYQTRPFLQSILQAFVLHLAVWNEAKTYFSSSVHSFMNHSMNARLQRAAELELTYFQWRSFRPGPLQFWHSGQQYGQHFVSNFAFHHQTKHNFTNSYGRWLDAWARLLSEPTDVSRSVLAAGCKIKTHLSGYYLLFCFSRFSFFSGYCVSCFF